MKRALLFVALLSACDASIFSRGLPIPTGPTGGGTGTGGGAELPSCEPNGKNDEVRLALHAACAGCHLTGNRPFFASLDAFENGLVYDPKYVKPGDPAGSLLVQMLKGVAPGSYPQMPVGTSYEALLQQGVAKLTIAEVEQWVRDLPPAGVRNSEPSPALFTVRRLAADDMVLSLLDQLGLGVQDFVDTSRPTWREEEYTARGGTLFVWPRDWAPGISRQYVSDSRATERFEALGGAVTLDYRKRDATLGPSALQTLVQMSQAWCRAAVEKQGNRAVLRHVTLADTSATKQTEIKQNISALYLRMLGEVASQGEVDAVYTQVYLPYEATNTRTAWTAVCASFVRHPLWVSF
ncbi:MAG: hypothetical protein JNK82_19575 [Myxococcaceae bacterium]|nr:hypothetical protein [Myxococcaceae bacterium]